MAKVNTFGVDLVKNVIQSSIVSPSGKEIQKKELTRIKFAEFLAKQKPSLVAFEPALRRTIGHGMHNSMAIKPKSFQLKR